MGNDGIAPHIILGNGQSASQPSCFSPVEKANVDAVEKSKSSALPVTGCQLTSHPVCRLVIILP